jgi:DNA-binding transcriptional regulator YhcF (GntR family)
VNDDRPVFVQIIEMVEDDILSGTYNAGDLIISTPQISKLLGVNPTTAQRAVTVLTDRGIITKKRGIGMAVTPEAREQILAARRRAFHDKAVPDFVGRARAIGITGPELLDIVQRNLP